MAYSPEFIMSVLHYAKANGPTKAATYFGIQYSTIRRWNEKYNIYTPQHMREFSEQQKIEILEYANKHGLTSAMREYDIDLSTMRTWNERLGLYQQTGRRNNTTHKKQLTHQSTEFKLAVLNFVKKHGLSKTISKYDLPYSTIREWNKVYKIYTPRKARVFSEAEKKLIIKYAENHSVPRAAREYNVTGDQIRKWAQKIYQKKL